MNIDQMMSHPPPPPAMMSVPPSVPVPVMPPPLLAGMFAAQRGGYYPWQPNRNPNAVNKKFNNNKKNWKGKNMNKDQRRVEISNLPFGKPTGMAVGGGYLPPSLNELQNQNRVKARKYYHGKKFNNNERGGSYRNYNRFAPYAPRNTSSFIIRAKKAGGIAELVSPCAVTPAVLPTPFFSPSREVLGDMAKEEWGVDGYGSMKGLIRLRSPLEGGDEDDEEGNGSSGSDVEEHVEVERRLDHDLSRFEMICPAGEYSSYGGGYNNVLENRVDDQDSHLAQLEEENLTLKERLFLMERELGDLRRRMQFLERQQFGNGMENVVGEEVVENMSENDENESDSGSDARGAGNDGQEDVLECVGSGDGEKNDQYVVYSDMAKVQGSDAVGESSEEGKLGKDEIMCEETEIERVVPNPDEDMPLLDADSGKEAVQDGLLAETDLLKEV